QVGAFPYASAASKDAALFQNGAAALAPGSYAVQVSGGGKGTVVAELYDATSAAALTSTSPRLINVSVLKQIGADASLTAGFVIGGSTAQTVLVRAIGPQLGLAPFNLSSAMREPILTLVSSRTGATLASNSSWGGDPQISHAANRVGAFAITNRE